MTDDLCRTLVHAATRYDRKQEKRSGYNIYALAQYMTRIDECLRDHRAGMSLRDALIGGFNGKLLDALLKSVGEAPHDWSKRNPMASYKPYRAPIAPCKHIH